MSIVGLDRSPQAKLNQVRKLVEMWERVTTFEGYDPLVTEYAQFLVDIKRLDPLSQDRYIRLHPVIAEVDYLIGASTGGLLKTQAASVQQEVAVLKSLVIGGDSAEDIADFLDLRPETVRAYEKLAWDVRARMRSPGWVEAHVFRSPIMAGLDSFDYERTYMVIAYRYGAELLRNTLNQRNSKDLVKALLEAINTNFLVQALDASLKSRPNSFNAPELVKLVFDKKKADDAAAARAGEEEATTPDESAIKQRLEHLLTMGFSSGGVGLIPAPIQLHSHNDTIEHPTEDYTGSQDFAEAILQVLTDQNMLPIEKG